MTFFNFVDRPVSLTRLVGLRLDPSRLRARALLQNEMPDAEIPEWKIDEVSRNIRVNVAAEADLKNT